MTQCFAPSWLSKRSFRAAPCPSLPCSSMRSCVVASAVHFSCYVYLYIHRQTPFAPPSPCPLPPAQSDARATTARSIAQASSLVGDIKQSDASSSSAPTTEVGTASDTLSVGVSGNVICLHTNSPHRRESDWERPRKVKDLKVDVKLERSADGGWSFSIEDAQRAFEVQAITSYRGTYRRVCVSGHPSFPISLVLANVVISIRRLLLLYAHHHSPRTRRLINTHSTRSRRSTSLSPAPAPRATISIPMSRCAMHLTIWTSSLDSRRITAPWDSRHGM